jgi:hypothetical protein
MDPCFVLMSDMRVNYHKSEPGPNNLENEKEILSFANIFGYHAETFPIKYLGIPLHHHKLSREDLQPLVDTIIKMIALGEVNF